MNLRPTLFFVLWIMSCHRAPDSSELKRDFSLDSYDFCQLSRNNTENSVQAVTWNKSRVQAEISRLLSAPDIAGTFFRGYPAVYQAMTAQRDIERCGGTLQGKDAMNQMLGDRLADMMTRFYIREVEGCRTGSILASGSSGFCQLMADAKNDHYDALSFTMASTAIYISSHIALSLRAVLADDDFWDSLGGETTWDVRLLALKSYRSDYDKFNGFLADQLSTVTEALHREELLGNANLALAASLAQYLSFRECAFKKIRDQAFEVAVADAVEFQGRKHPMMQVSHSRYKVADRFDAQVSLTEKTAKLEAFALRAVAGPEQRLVYRYLLGGKSWEDTLKELPPKTLECRST